jgi:hypothetical protein
VSEYRLYFMDRFSGHIEHRHDFKAVGDAEAIRIASVWRNGHPMELWQRTRKVQRWEAIEVSPPPVLTSQRFSSSSASS